MNTLLLPDLLAMTFLLCVLALVRQRYPHHGIRLWISGLLLILLECAARMMYGVRLPLLWHNLAHIVALDAYLLAGTLFLLSSHDGIRRMPRAGLFKTINTAPAFLLLTFYGAGLKESPVYVITALCGIAVAIATCTVLRRPRMYLLVLLSIWLPTMVAALFHLPRVSVYLVLALLYFTTACSFAVGLPARSSGKIAVVAGFSVWALCFLTHPWIATEHPAWVALVSEVWNMQKFLITVGFLVVLFERQVNNNEWMALHDQLTGLPNRRLFQDRISNAIARAERDRTGLILFCLDLNNFKEVNDTLGHDAGDVLLRSVAASLQRVVRRTDTLARLGGDEFTLLATDVKAARAPKKERRWLRPGQQTEDSEQEHDRPVLADAAHTLHNTEHPILRHATRIEQDIRAAVDGPLVLEDRPDAKPVQVSISIGVAVYPTDSTDLAELTRIADQRMYDDKRRQRADRGGFERVLSLLTTT